MNGKILRNTLAAGLLFACVSPALTRAQSGSQDSGQTQTAPAQNAQTGPNLNLTDDQQAQIKQIHQDTEAQIKAIESNSSLSAAQKQEQIHQIREDARKQEEALLTPEQKKILEQWRASHRGGSHR
jgi:Spy/CpxP family protein refolding chaperone